MENDDLDKRLEQFDAKKDLDKHFEFTTFADLISGDYPEVEWLIDRIIPVASLGIISGNQGSHKTWLMSRVACSLATGSDLFGKFPTRKVPVLIIDEEMGERRLQPRFLIVTEETDIPIYFLSKKQFALNEENIKLVLKKAKAHGVQIIMIDSFVRVCNKIDENKANEVAEAFKLLAPILDAGISIFFLHHNNKRGGYRGSSDIAAVVDWHLTVEKPDGEDVLKIEQRKMRDDEELKPFKLKIIKGNNNYDYEFIGDVELKKSKNEMAKGAILETLEETSGLSVKELTDAVYVKNVAGKNTIANAVQELVQMGEIVQVQAEGKGNLKLCYLPTDEHSQMFIDLDDSENPKN